MCAADSAKYEEDAVVVETQRDLVTEDTSMISYTKRMQFSVPDLSRS